LPRRSVEQPGSRVEVGSGGRSEDELTIYIVEDSEHVRDRLIESVGELPNTRVVGAAAAVPEALEGVRASQPRVLILGNGQASNQSKRQSNRKNLFTVKIR